MAIVKFILFKILCENRKIHSHRHECKNSKNDMMCYARVSTDESGFLTISLWYINTSSQGKNRVSMGLIWICSVCKKPPRSKCWDRGWCIFIMCVHNIKNIVLQFHNKSVEKQRLWGLGINGTIFTLFLMCTNLVFLDRYISHKIEIEIDEK